MAVGAVSLLGVTQGKPCSLGLRPKGPPSHYYSTREHWTLSHPRTDTPREITPEIRDPEQPLILMGANLLSSSWVLSALCGLTLTRN